MSDEDWLDIDEKPPALPVPVNLPDNYVDRLQLAEACWSRLTETQKTFLAAWRDCMYNQRAAQRQLGRSENAKPMTHWMHEPDFATVVRIWRANAAANALDRDRLLARQDEIVEALMTPKPILHQGLPVFDPRRPGAILEEIDAGAASRANEVLLDRVMPKGDPNAARTRVVVNVVRLTGEPDPQDDSVVSVVSEQGDE